MARLNVTYTESDESADTHRGLTTENCEQLIESPISTDKLVCVIDSDESVTIDGSETVEFDKADLVRVEVADE